MIWYWLLYNSYYILFTTLYKFALQKSSATVIAKQSVDVSTLVTTSLVGDIDPWKVITTDERVAGEAVVLHPLLLTLLQQSPQNSAYVYIHK